MRQETKFQSENFLISVFGQLVLLAIIFLSFSVVIERAKLVTPNRVQIIELDLKKVKITGDETKLYNTVKPDEKTPEKQEIEKTIDEKKKLISTKQRDKGTWRVKRQDEERQALLEKVTAKKN